MRAGTQSFRSNRYTATHPDLVFNVLTLRGGQYYAKKRLMPHISDLNEIQKVEKRVWELLNPEFCLAHWKVRRHWQTFSSACEWFSADGPQYRLQHLCGEVKKIWGLGLKASLFLVCKFLGAFSKINTWCWSSFSGFFSAARHCRSMS